MQWWTTMLMLLCLSGFSAHITWAQDVMERQGIRYESIELAALYERVGMTLADQMFGNPRQRQSYLGRNVATAGDLLGDTPTVWAPDSAGCFRLYGHQDIYWGMKVCVPAERASQVQHTWQSACTSQGFHTCYAVVFGEVRPFQGDTANPVMIHVHDIQFQHGATAFENVFRLGKQMYNLWQRLTKD